jgi:hypothetical protein
MTRYRYNMSDEYEPVSDDYLEQFIPVSHGNLRAMALEILERRRSQDDQKSTPNKATVSEIFPKEDFRRFRLDDEDPPYDSLREREV